MGNAANKVEMDQSPPPEEDFVVNWDHYLVDIETQLGIENQPGKLDAKQYHWEF